MDLMDAYTRAEALLTQHGLGDWHVEFDQAKRRAGVCRESARVIGLSAPLTRLHEEAEVTDTILHEIAHALVGGTVVKRGRTRYHLDLGDLRLDVVFPGVELVETQPTDAELC